jgi:hypothetical protein
MSSIKENRRAILHVGKVTSELRVPTREVRTRTVSVKINPETLLDFQSDFDTYISWMKLKIEVDPAQMGKSALQQLLLQHPSQNGVNSGTSTIPTSGNLDKTEIPTNPPWQMEYSYTYKKDITALRNDLELFARATIMRELQDIEDFVLNNSEQLDFIRHFSTHNFSVLITPTIHQWALQNAPDDD